MAENILVVEDDVKLLKLIQTYLSSQGYEVSGETRGDRAPDRILNELPDLVILDLMLPGCDGLSVLRTVRSRYTKPVLILTAKEDDMDQVAGLEAGADDYVKKPVVPRVLLARIRAVLRRSTEAFAPSREIQQEGFRFGSLLIEGHARRVTLDGKSVELSTTEFDLLWYLAQNAGRTITREALYLTLKGYDYDGIDRRMDLSVSRLRKKLGDHTKSPFRIKTVWGSGYLFVPDAWGTP